MATFKFVIADPKTRKSYKVEKDQNEVAGLVGKKIGEKFNGDLVGLKGYEIVITGGTDKDGFPMHPNVHGMVKKKIILSGPPCFHPKRKGMRKRKMIVGNTLTKTIAQVNCKIVKQGPKGPEELLGKKDQPKESETPKEQPKQESPKEQPKQEAKKPEKKEVKVEKPKEEKKPEEPKEEKKKEQQKVEKPKEEKK